jgi:signal transduction histidine kinase
VRTRITLAATAVVSVALVLGAVVFAGLLSLTLTEQMRTAVVQDAEQYADQFDETGPPEELPEVEDGFLQVLDEDGRVVAASDDAEDAGPLRPPGSDEVWTVRLPGEDPAYLAASADSDDLLVVAGRSRETVDRALGTVTVLLAVAVPLLIGLVAVTTWFVVQRALRPVDRMRREVDEVTENRLHTRVADPGGSDELARLAATMNSMLARLEQAQRSQRQFVSDASHELRSPLASLRQYAEVAASHPDRVSAAELSEAILDEGARLERLVHGMLLLARSDEQTEISSTTAVDLDDLVLREARRLRESTALSVDAAAVGPARVRGDAGLLEQVVRNLTDNAARHAASRIRFALTDEVLLLVEDDGTGVPAADRDRVFERFARLDEARDRDSGGSGLGLAIVRELVQAHGGSAAVSSSPLGGARFEVRLPPANDL